MTPKKKIQIIPVEKIWLSQQEAAEYLGMGKSFIVSLRKSGTLPHYMVGNSAFFKKEDIDNLIESNRVY